MKIGRAVCSAVLVLVMTSAVLHAQTPVPADSTATQPDSSATPLTTAPPPPSTSQVRSSQPPLRDRVYFGGSVVFSLGGDVSTIGVYPMIGYKIKPKWSVGLEAGYEHVTYDDIDESADNYGGSLFTRYRLLPSIYAHAEYQMINYEFFIPAPNLEFESTRDWVPFLLLGGGLSRQIAPRTWAYAEILFDVLRDNNSPYDDWEPFISVGVGVGF